MQANPSVAVIIRCCNEEQHIGRLLSGILEQTLADRLEIIVVDSGSSDATLTIAARFPVKIITLSPQEFSFGRSLNLGCEAAQSEFIVAASAHVYPVYKDWLDRLLAPFANERIALVYGKQRGDVRSRYSEQRIFSAWFPDRSNDDQAHPFCNNANAAIRRSCWCRLRYDETLTGLEDLDWARRALQLGYRVAYAADAEVVHVHHESPSRIFNRYRREAIALKHIFPQERFSRWDFLRLYGHNVFSDSYHAWRDGLLWGNIYSILMFRLMQFWGTRRGFAQRGTVTNQLRRRFYYPDQGECTSSARPESARRRINYLAMVTKEQHGAHH